MIGQEANDQSDGVHRNMETTAEVIVCVSLRVTVQRQVLVSRIPNANTEPDSPSNHSPHSGYGIVCRSLAECGYTSLYPITGDN